MEKPDQFLTACKPGAEDIPAMQNRVNWLNMLYHHEGRDKPDHPKHGLYTGLNAEHFPAFAGKDDD
jgi:hypothetical protein